MFGSKADQRQTLMAMFGYYPQIKRLYIEPMIVAPKSNGPEIDYVIADYSKVQTTFYLLLTD